MPGQQNKNVWDMAYGLLLTIALLITASAVGYLFRAAGIPETNIVIVYLLAVLLTARITRGYVFGLFASVIATGAFNYLFTEPYFAFRVNAPSYIITFVIMTITALITSALTSHAKQNALEAREKEAETKALYTLTDRLTDAADLHDIAGIAASTISDVFCCRAACLYFDENGVPEQTYIQQASPGKLVRRKLSNPEKIKRWIEELSTGYHIGTDFYDWPIHGREMILGLIRLPKESAALMSEAQTRLLHSMIESIALAMDRLRSIQQGIKSNEEAVQERYRGNLLRAISHDLRTPLSGIMGTAEMLMDMTQREDPRYALAEGIHKEADWLHSLVENILNLTRLQGGKLTLNKQMEAVEEVVGGAVSHMAKRSPKHEITVNTPGELLLVPMDARLIEQVLINLLDNAIRHTPPQNEISVSVIEDKKKGCAVFSVKDRGEGIAAADLPHIFQMFYVSPLKHTDARYGIGLGLAICDAIIKAHGGGIEAHNRTDGPGAEFIFTLPMEMNNHEQLS